MPIRVLQRSIKKAGSLEKSESFHKSKTMIKVHELIMKPRENDNKNSNSLVIIGKY
jgi:hypothetical protein